MTDWDKFTAADFDISQAPKTVQREAEAGQEALFTTGTPTRAPKTVQPKPELAGQSDLFGEPAGHTTH